MPYTTAQKKLAGVNWLQYIISSAVSQQATSAAEQQIAALLRERHRLRTGEADDFTITGSDALAQAQAQSNQVMTLLLVSIACVSLLVGGIGIMNIMLVSVTERTREIGVRMAIGATEYDVQMQFLSEAMVLSLFGGAAGTLLGVAGSKLISSLLGWPTTISAGAVVIAVIFSAAIGVFFGYYPTRQAARLDPIQALRFE